MGWLRGARYIAITERFLHSSFFKGQILGNSIDKRLIFVCCNILRSLIHEPKQGHYTYLIDSLFLLHILLTVYRVANYYDKFFSWIYHLQRTV